MTWLSKVEEWTDEEAGIPEYDLTEAIEHIKRMNRVIRDLAASGPLLRNIHTSLLMSESRNEGLPPQVQYWLQEIPKFLDNLPRDAKELIK